MGAISMRSSPASRARARASSFFRIPRFSPDPLITRSSGAIIWLLTLVFIIILFGRSLSYCLQFVKREFNLYIRSVTYVVRYNNDTVTRNI